MSSNTSALLQQTLAQLKPEDLNNSFWQFACHVYAADEVSQALLMLQDLYAENICFILYLLWLSKHQHELDATQLVKIKRLAEIFEQDCITPIRNSRKNQKILALNTAIYSQTKALELTLERQLIAILFTCSRDTNAIRNSITNTAEQCLLNALEKIYADEQDKAISTKIIALQQLIRI